ncbi:MAG: DNA recombination protein RmuC [Acidobacteriia bacterium]|nr:DNA recombination protein RmuC [Terriglobia bacterium]
MSLSLVFVAIFGAMAGGLITWLFLRSQSAVLESRLSSVQLQLTAARGDVTKYTQLASNLKSTVDKLETAMDLASKANQEKLDLVNHATENLREAFRALSSDALKSNNQAFLELATTSLEKFQSEAKGDLEMRQKAVATLVAPIEESLRKVDDQITQIEKERSLAYGGLTEQVRSLITTQEKLHAETGNLVKALRTPTVRGRWGEIQLKRVIELAGMLSYCDFVEQETVTTSAGRIRPDVIVKLPGGKNIVIDAKTPLLAYLEAIESTDDEVRRQKLELHAAQVRTHMDQLGDKAYQQQFDSPEFVVMFLPGETFFSAALEQDSSLIERGVLKKVIPASPTTLIALLKAVAYGWNQEKLARNASEISRLGKELHDRLRNMGTHVEALGKGLDRAVESYNKAVGTLESRVMVSARKFAELGAEGIEEIPPLSVIDTTARNLTLEFDDLDSALDAGSTESPKPGTKSLGEAN